MNGMLQHQELFSEEIKRHQQEAHKWAGIGAMGRLAARAREDAREHPRRTRLMAIASPMAVGLALLAILI